VIPPSIILAQDSGKCEDDGVGVPTFGIMFNGSKRLPTPVPLSRNVFFDLVSVAQISASTVNNIRRAAVIELGTVFHLTNPIGELL